MDVVDPLPSGGVSARLCSNLFRLPGIGSHQRGFFHQVSAHACFDFFVEGAGFEVELSVKCE